ncbi:hypothetical protein PN499_23310 [Kamptonema animale CS-326]|jgi:two-component sensor histidine kinase|uniref:hypothetical protein n=1 Tax=Kamptonema animale TaxID=92934 RepID=UPI00232CE0E5|nr:hypothetical protein [Kamptonema animale]MDB9514134.1 hypothetical protein [Kamptonema animale CS-326]
MSESVEYPFVPLTDAINLCQQDLWRFNGGIQPKFWFGDKVKFDRRTAVVLGMQWDESISAAWWYFLLLEGDGDVELRWKAHENSLSFCDCR